MESAECHQSGTGTLPRFAQLYFLLHPICCNSSNFREFHFQIEEWHFVCNFTPLVRADYRVGASRVIANPHGYGRENAKFDPTFIIEVRS